jgi:hypothetical protein
MPSCWAWRITNCEVIRDLDYSVWTSEAYVEREEGSPKEHKPGNTYEEKGRVS